MTCMTCLGKVRLKFETVRSHVFSRVSLIIYQSYVVEVYWSYRVSSNEFRWFLFIIEFDLAHSQDSGDNDRDDGSEAQPDAW